VLYACYDTLQASNAAANSASVAPYACAGNPSAEAWHTLETACTDIKVTERANATLALGLVRDNVKARKLAEKALSDPKPEVRSAGAAALGEMGSRKSISKLIKALDDKAFGSIGLCVL
jgi:hypothetical protein